jgi:hypothetical protein
MGLEVEVSGQLHASVALPPAKEPQFPFSRRPGGPQSRSGRCGEEKKLAMPEFETGPFSS